MKVALTTLGCKVNLYESEYVLSKLKENNYIIVDFNDLADIYIINTCSVTNASDVKSRKLIRQAIRKNKEAIIIVMGCYSQINSDEVAKIDGVDIILGNKDKSKIIAIIEAYKKNKELISNVYDLNNVPFENMEIDHLENKTRAFVKIQDGCNNYCSYCIIPFTRGKPRSKLKEDVLEEINKLVANNYKEIVLTGIHTGNYGAEFTNYRLSNLLKDLLKIEDLKRIRISSIEITEINDEILSLMQDDKVIADHLHIPLQSGSDSILKAMNRHYDTKYFEERIKKIRGIRKDIAITTDVIVGFPFESDENFEDTYQFIKKINFSKLHVFPYSKRDKTKASLMINQVDSQIKKERTKRLIALSKDLELDYMNKFIDKDLEIIPEIYKDGYLIGYSSNYLRVKIKGDKEDINKLIKVTVKMIDYPFLIAE